ncbi:MAG: hypothetical protein JWM85_2578, partial [Acidimicrobiaceae bacterium]|nr:hypothetical protein [Acidimicrobiaceae bacterium]
YLDGPTPAQVVPNGATGRGAASFLAAERLLGRYDRVCYSLGNSHHHLGALAALRERPGVVIAHDVRLSNCYRHEHGDPRGLRGGLGRAIQRLYPGGSLPEELGATDELSPADLERYGLLMASEAIGASQAFLVSSKAAAALARLDAGPTGAQKVRLLPFAVEAPGLDRSAYLDQPGEGDPLPAGVGTGAAPLIAHFGIVDPVKQPEVLLAATARLLPRHPGLRCAFVGPVSSQLADRLRDLAGSLGRPEVLVLAGPVGPESYLSALRRTTVAVQLRDGFNGEASAATGECLACGVPTVVTRSGWAKELPPDAVVALEAPVGTDELTATLDRLLSDGARRSSLSEAALRAAAGRSFAATARALLAELELAGPSPDDSGLDDSGLDEPGLDDSGLDDSGLDDSGLDDSGPGDSGPGDSALSEPA